MTTLTTNYGALVAYAVAASLAAANYDQSGNATPYNSTTNKPADVRFEYAATLAAAPTGNKQIVLFVQGSLDGTTWGAVPSSATDTSHDVTLRWLGAISVVAAEAARETFSIAAAFGGVLPAYWRVIVKNDTGVALGSCSARTQELSLSAA
jgi:hypothetical protein